MNHLRRASVVVLILLCSLLVARAETIVLQSGKTVEGIILRTNGGDFLVLTEFGTMNFGQKNSRTVRGASAETTKVQPTGRMPNLKTALLSLSGEPWGGDVIQIPATVVDKGMFRDVPYLSFRCSGDYEFNVYGDLNDPAAIELGVYRGLLKDPAAKELCIAFISGILGDNADREVIAGLSRDKDLKHRKGFTFEITPPTDEDSYGGWWISVYSEDKVNQARATEKELKEITLAKGGGSGDWSASEMKLARPNLPETVTFITTAGVAVADAEVVRVVDNAYLIWRKGASGGMVRLSDLSKELQSRFGYNAERAAAIYAAEESRKSQAAQPQSQAAQTPPPQPANNFYDYGSSYASSASSGSSGGRVYVHGYTRKDGTYVHSYTRRR